MIIFALEVLLLFASSYLFVKKFFLTRFLADFILAWFTLLFAQIVLIELFWGIIGRLYFINIFLSHFIVFLAAFLLPRKRQAPIIKPEIEPLLNSKLLLLAFSVFAAFFAVKVSINLVNPPICADSWQYHLAFPAVWIKNARLDNPFVIFAGIPTLNPNSLDPSRVSYDPINAQLFFTWLMIPLKNAFLADIGESPFYFIGIILVAKILRSFGIERKIALLAGFLWALIPSIFKQLKYGTHIDVICAVLFLLVFYTALLLKDKFSFKNAILFGIAAGLFLGTKTINFVWFFAMFPFFICAFYGVINKNKLTVARVSGKLGVIIFLLLLFGGFAFIRNFIFTGNPFFPIEIRFFGQTVFKGLLDAATFVKLVAPEDTFNLKRILFSEGLGVQFVALIFPSIFFPLIFYRHLKRKMNPPREYLILFLTPLIMFVLFRILINEYIMRYLYPLISMGLITAVIFISLLRGANKYFNIISFVAILASASELAHRKELILSLFFSTALFLFLLCFKNSLISYAKKAFNPKYIFVFIVFTLAVLYLLNEKYNKEEFSRYPLIFRGKESWQKDIGFGWKWLNEHTGSGKKVAYTGRSDFYPLFGTRLKNDVQYISINSKRITPYNAPDGLYRKERDVNAWLRNLAKEKIEYLFVVLPFFENKETGDPSKFPIEDEWALAHPDNFKLEFKNSLCRIYNIINLVCADVL